MLNDQQQNAWKTEELCRVQFFFSVIVVAVSAGGDGGHVCITEMYREMLLTDSIYSMVFCINNKFQL